MSSAYVNSNNQGGFFEEKVYETNKENDIFSKNVLEDIVKLTKMNQEDYLRKLE